MINNTIEIFEKLLYITIRHIYVFTAQEPTAMTGVNKLLERIIWLR